MTIQSPSNLWPNRLIGDDAMYVQKAVGWLLKAASLCHKDGIVTYPTFAVQIDRLTLKYSGSIDLNARTVDLRTEIPFTALANRCDDFTCTCLDRPERAEILEIESDERR